MKRIFIALFLLLGFGVAVYSWVTDVKAVPLSNVWLNGEVAIKEEATVTGYHESMYPCSATVSSIDVKRFGRFTDACVHGSSDQLRIARYIESGTYQYSVAFPGQEVFHELRGLCPFPKCSYASGTDVLIVHHGLPGWRWGIGLYKDFSKSLVRVYDEAIQSYYYSFQPNRDPDLLLEIGQWKPSVEATAVSRNSKWAVLELRSFGLVRVNLEDLSIKRVSAPGAEYGLANDPSYELAISNDGKLIAGVGWRLGLSVIHITDECGDYLTENTSKLYSQGVVGCRSATISDDIFQPGWRLFSQPRFNSRADRLSVLSFHQDGTIKRMILGTDASVPATGLGYLALGDSFTSGEGELHDALYKVGSNTLSTRCHVSLRSYPYKVAQYWRVKGENVACSGARSADILGSSEYTGQRSHLESASESERFDAKTEALETYRAGVAPQIDFVSHYQPDVTTASIGGNDAGLIGKLTACLGLGTCEWVTDASKKYATAEEIASVYPKLKSVIKEIQLLSPRTNVKLVGYPLIIDDSVSAKCGGVIGLLLGLEERVFVNEAIKYLNQVIRAAAWSEGADYIDVETSFTDRRLCGLKTPSAMNGVRFGDDIAPLKFLSSFKLIGAESFHPTPLGHEYISRMITRNYPTVSMQCAECQGEASSLPHPSDYWGEKPIAAEYVQQREDPTIAKDVFENKSKQKISAKALTFMPGTAVKVSIHSDPIELSEIQSEEDGSINLITEIPHIPPGYHVLHLFGTTPDGIPVDIYKTIAVVDDVDSSGVVVNSQKPDEIQSVPGLAGITQPSLADNFTRLSQTKSDILGVGVVTSQPNSRPSKNLDFTPVLLIGSIGVGIVISAVVAILFLRRSSRYPDG